MDITERLERLRTAENLHRRQAMLEEAEALSHVGSWIWDVADDSAVMSAEGGRIWGIPVDSPPHPLGRFIARIDPEDRPLIEGAVRHAVEAGEDYDVVTRILRDGKARLVRHRGWVTQRKDGKAVRLAGTIEDVTDSKAAEQQLKQLHHMEDLNEFKSQFIGMVAHDLNNVLTPMHLNLGVADNEMAKLGGDRNSLDRLKSNLDRLSGFLGDLLDAARLQSGHLDLDVRPFNLAASLRRTVDALRPEAEGLGLHLALTAPPALPIMADQRRLEQVTTNLLSNAFKFTPKNGAVRVELKTTADGAGLIVTDTGPGVDAADLAKLFQPFTRLLTVPQGHHTGTGLGLYICRGIVEQHGGRIWCESKGEGKGASFCISLPLAAPEKALRPK
ncbi:MAG TPA: ATP-binding protein [Candidatus Thermoplasmatota archaeon]|nr:ATP-binding protein [Candidatus Thermoplasmatota archaeon]